MMEFGKEVDLHHFHPRDTKAVVEEFLRQAVEKGYVRVRIVHGKGRSQKKSQVYAILQGHRQVKTYHDEGANWGATVVFLYSSDDDRDFPGEQEYTPEQ